MRRTLEPGELAAAVIVVALAVPFVYLFSTAFADGEVRRMEAPLRAMLGDAYDALRSGEPVPQHYLGDDRRAPDFSLPRADGSEWRLSDHRGKVVVLNFWTVTCRPCLEEMPSLIALSRILRYRDDIELATISTDADWATVRTVLPEQTPVTVLLDPDKAVVEERFGTRLYPETWVIDPEGVIRLRVDGARDWSSAVAMDVFESFL
ncbi:MAG: peroxiredoxin family protein [Sandaracinaceae bacterium]